MIEVKHFSGKLDTDSREENILPMDHIQSLNGRFYGTESGLTFENVRGNEEIVNRNLPDSDNECIGAVFDQVNQRIFWFNWNINNSHGIYMYDIDSETITALLINFIDSQPGVDLFNFDRDFPVANPLILYTTPLDGDLLCYTARNDRPKCLNIKQAIENQYGSNWLPQYLDVAKDTPAIPPVVAYENDDSVTVNNLRKKLFQFKFRFWYRDNQKSTWSSISEIPVPFQYTDPQVDTDPTKNCKIGCVIQTGDPSVVKIEIAAAESLGNVFSNYFSVVILNKFDLTIPDNDTYLWFLFNSEAYVFVDIDESILDFSRVPYRTNDQAIINGNVLSYGGITEGLDPVIPIIEIDVDTEPFSDIIANTGFSVTQFGTKGFQQSKNIRIIFIGVPRLGDIPTYIVNVIGFGVFTIAYTIQVGDTTLDVLTGLSLSATSQGFTQVSIDDNQLVIDRVNQVLLNYFIFGAEQNLTGEVVVNHAANTVTLIAGGQYASLFTKGVQFYLDASANVGILTVVSSADVSTSLVITVTSTTINETLLSTIITFVNPVNNSVPAYNSSSKENWSLIYHGKKDETNGATTSQLFNVETPPLLIQVVSQVAVFNVPFVTTRILHRPPLWAYTYQWARSANLTKESWLYWVTNSTFKDDKYAYISIESINAYKRVNPNSIISYDFAPGDRIKFYILYNTVAVPVQIYGNEHDYEIYAQVINPDINGVNRVGQFVKIVLPTVDSTFNFSTGLTLDFDFYYIELYTPAKSAAEGLNVYYEFSEEYGIGNPGTTLAFHQGELRNQSTNLSISALTQFNKGDAWYRTRIIGIGNTLLYDLTTGYVGGIISGGGGGPSVVNPFILGLHLTVQAYTTSDYVVAQDVANGALIPPNYNQPGWIISTSINATTFKLTGAINLTIQQTNGADIFAEIFIINSTQPPGTFTNILLDTQSGIGAGGIAVFDIDSSITIPPNSRIWLTIRSTGPNIPFTFNVVSGFVSFTEPNKDFEVGVIDQNFSDFFPSKVNSNGRSFIVNPDEKQNLFGTTVRYGGQYEQNTNINQLNIFYPDSFVEAYASWGQIQRMVVWGNQLRLFQERRVGYFGIYAKYIQTSDSDTQITTTNDILTKTNIQYYEGEYGLGKQYTGLCISKSAIYFDDPVRGYEVRLAADGLIPISELYKGMFFIRSLLIPFNGNLVRPNGASAKIMKFYDTFLEEAVTILQEAVDPKGAGLIAPQTFSFNEPRNAYSSFFSYFPEIALCAEDVIYSFKDGKIFVHNSDTYCKFYGIQYEVSITIVCNLHLLEKKTWGSITEISSAIWACSIIYSNVASFPGQRQQTMLGEYDFANLESNFHSAILRDQNSIGGILNGATMKGNYLCVKLIKQNASDLIYLSEVSVRYIDSPLTNK